MFARLIQIAVLASGLAFVNSASAEEAAASNGSEFFYQSEAGKFEVTPHLLIQSTVTKYNETNTGYKNLKGTVAELPIGVALEYGITQMISVGLNLGYSNTHYSFTCDSLVCPKNTTSKGLNDPSVDVKARLAAGPGTVRFGANLSVSIEKSKTDSSGDTNAASGGSTITPFVGYELPLGPGFIGGKLSYDLYKGDRKSTDNSVSPVTDSTTTGGQNLDLTAFYEANIGKVTYGGALIYSSTTTTKVAEGTAASASRKDATTLIEAQFYVPVHITPTITVLPVAGLGGVTYNSSGAEQDSSALIFIGVGGRFAF